MDAIFKAALVNSTKWQYYGTPGFNGSLEMTWDPLLVNAERVNLELWGYAETGESAISSTLKILKRKSQFSTFFGHLLVDDFASDIFSPMLTAFQQNYWLFAFCFRANPHFDGRSTFFCPPGGQTKKQNEVVWEGGANTWPGEDVVAK